MSSLLRNNISHERFPLKSPLQLLQLPWSEYHGCWVWVHWVVALNVGPLFLSFVSSLNDDVCEPFALIEVLTNHVAVWAWKTWNECTLVQSTYHTWVMNLEDFVGSGHPQNAPEYRKSYPTNSKMCSFSQFTSSWSAQSHGPLMVMMKNCGPLYHESCPSLWDSDGVNALFVT